MLEHSNAHPPINHLLAAASVIAHRGINALPVPETADDFTQSNAEIENNDDGNPNSELH